MGKQHLLEKQRLVGKKTPGRINLCHDWKRICVIKLLPFKSMCNQPHIQNWHSHLGEWRERQVREHCILGVRRGWMSASVQDSMKTLSKHSERNKEMEKGTERKADDSKEKLHWYRNCICGQSYNMETRKKSNSVSSPIPHNSIIWLILLKYCSSIIYSKLFIYIQMFLKQTICYLVPICLHKLILKKHSVVIIHFS